MSEVSQPDEHDQALLEIKFEYAWRWFSLHARQRVTMFNYFLVASGVLANAYGLLLSEKLFFQACAAATIGFIACLVSIGLDIRNHQLVKFGEDVLVLIERNCLFREGPQSPDGNSPRYGILYRESCFGMPYRLFKHKILIRFLESVVSVGFLGAAIYAAVQLVS